MKNFLLLLSATVGLAAPARAITVTLDAERLTYHVNESMPVRGLIVLTAGLTGTFTGPTPGTFAGTGEMVLKTWDLSSFSTPGVFSDIATNLELGGGWDPGDPLRLYWYPTLTLGDAFPGYGTAYGTFRSALGEDGSAPWITPGAGATISLKFFTTDSTFLSSGGSNPASAGLANLTVIPEPATALLLLAAGGFAAVRRWRRHGNVLSLG